MSYYGRMEGELNKDLCIKNWLKEITPEKLHLMIDGKKTMRPSRPNINNIINKASKLEVLECLA